MAESKYEDEEEGEEGEREETAGDGDDHGGGLWSSTSALSGFVYGTAISPIDDESSDESFRERKW